MPGLRRHRPAAGIAAAALLLWLVGLALAPPAGAYVYWTDGNRGSIGRAKLDGSVVIRSFIPDISFPESVAVDANYVYWTSSSGGTIGRAKLNGTGADHAFLTGSGETDGVAVDSGHIYWTNRTESTIGRAKLDGTGVDQSFISADLLGDVAVGGGHIYWTDRDMRTIGRARLNGTGVEQSFIETLGFPHKLALDADHIYWVTTNPNPPFNGVIGRAKLDGTEVAQLFTTSAIAFGFGLTAGLAVDADHLYWADFSFSSVVRSDIDGSGVDVHFIPELGFPLDVAVDARPLPPDAPPETTITKRPPNKSKRRRAKFKFVASRPTATFQCKLDQRPFRSCSSPHKLRRLKRGGHVFKVRAVDATGNADPSPARDKFKIKR
jgi:sugar lactone lactonase YvrE